MINKLSLKTAQWFTSRYNTYYDNLEIYQYAFFIIYTNLMFLFFSLILGAILGVIYQSIFFYFAFFSIRQFAGGYHSSTEIRCEIITTLSLTACIFVI